MALNLNEEATNELLEIWGNLLEDDSWEDALHDAFGEAVLPPNIWEFILLPEAAAENNDDEEAEEDESQSSTSASSTEDDKDDESVSSSSASTEDDEAESASNDYDELLNSEEEEIRKRLKATRLFTQLLRKEITVKQFMDEYIAIRNDGVDNYLDDFIPQHI